MVLLDSTLNYYWYRWRTQCLHCYSVFYTRLLQIIVYDSKDFNFFLHCINFEISLLNVHNIASQIHIEQIMQQHNNYESLLTAQQYISLECSWLKFNLLFPFQEVKTFHNGRDYNRNP